MKRTRLLRRFSAFDTMKRTSAWIFCLCCALCSLGLPEGAAAIRRPASPFGIRMRTTGGDALVGPAVASANAPRTIATGASIARRGGACSDSTPSLFAKIGLSALVETGLMYALVGAAVNLNAKGSRTMVATRAVQAAALLVVIFGSASFGSIIDNGLSAATKQLLDPNTIPVSICAHYVLVVMNRLNH